MDVREGRTILKSSRTRYAALPAFVLVALLGMAELAAQTCQLTVAGLNRERQVIGPITSECPAPFHTAPFGNWGVTSNFGHKSDSHQFDGWCRDLEYCDNRGDCGQRCSRQWYEWNSCTDHSLFRAPNCSLYNSADCTEQVTSQGINVHGTRTVDVAVSCPRDADGDGAVDQGGCGDVSIYTHGANFMSLYELDPITGDDLVQTLLFPETPIQPACNPWECLPTGSGWVAPVGYDSPASPAKVYAEMAMALGSGVFVDPDGVCPVVAAVHAVSAASFAGPKVAPDSIVSVFGTALALQTAAATVTPLPNELAGVQVTVKDSGGALWLTPLLFVSSEQINFIMPAGVRPGPATVSVKTAGGVERAAGECRIETVSPGLFAANSDGAGIAAAVAVRVKSDGSQTTETVFSCSSADSRCRPAAIDLGPEPDQVVLSLFGTGIRGRTGRVTAQIGGETARVLYAGEQRQFFGLDQVNVVLPRTLLGRGELEVRVTVDGQAANTVTVEVR